MLVFPVPSGPTDNAMETEGLMMVPEDVTVRGISPLLVEVSGMPLLLVVPVLLDDFCKRPESWGDVAVSDEDGVTDKEVDAGKSDASTGNLECSLGAASCFSWFELDGKLAMATKEDNFICLRLREFGLLLLLRLYEPGIPALPGRDNRNIKTFVYTN